MSVKARYLPKNPGKYIGNPNMILARSRWEIAVMKFFDLSPAVKRWASEEIAIPYLSPKDNRVHRYFPDFYVEYLNKDGKIVKEIVEVKPLKESTDEAAKTVYDKQALVINKAKWAAATDFANHHGMTFRVITEQSIFKQVQAAPKKNKKPRKVKVAKPAIRPQGPTRGK